MAACWSPSYVQGGNQVACGLCRACRIRRKQAWVGRLRLEASHHEKMRWLTLTYSDEFNPGVLDYKDVQMWLDRERKWKGSFRYFVVGEYGEQTGRPHWHVCVFGHAQEFEGLIPEDRIKWFKGGALDGSLTLQSIGYTAGYTLKKGPMGQHSVSNMSLRPGIGAEDLMMYGRQVAKSGVVLKKWPDFYKIGDKSYPFYGGGRMYFKRGFEEAGGVPPETFGTIELTNEMGALYLQNWQDPLVRQLMAEARARKDAGAPRRNAMREAREQERSRRAGESGISWARSRKRL